MASSASKLLSQPLPSLGAIRAEIARREAERQRQDVARNADAIRARCATLEGFVREAWPILEPTMRYVPNWHISAICDHLESVTRGEISRLLINVWPGASKSLLVSVMWQAWEWGPMGLRSHRFLATSYGDGPVKRDTRKCRDLMLSEWYRALWPEVQLTRTAEMSFANSATGTREGVAFGSLTSQRGDRLIIDDPHSTETAESPAERVATTRKFREGALNRLNDQEHSAIVVIMQRLHEDDISGVIKKIGMDYTHLCLPMEFEPSRKCVTKIGFSDPREYDGELADPVRFPTEVLDALKRDMTSYAYAGQYQQRPAPREGAMFNPAKIIRCETRPECVLWVRAWDLAATKAGDHTAGVLMGRTQDQCYIIADVRRIRGTPDEVIELIANTASTDGVGVRISLPRDPGQASLFQVQYLTKQLSGFIVTDSPEAKNKAVRAEPFASQVNVGNVSMVRGDWNYGYIDELRSFPVGSHDDQLDASSRAFQFLCEETGLFVVTDGLLQAVSRPTHRSARRFGR